MTGSPVPEQTPLPRGLAGRTVVIAGGSSGIGLAAAVLLRTVGARVVVVARDVARLTSAAATLRAAPGPDVAVVALDADVSDEEALRRALEPVPAIDHVLVTAGTLMMGPFTEIDRRQGAVVMDSRLWAAYAAARVTGPRLPAGGSLTFLTGSVLVADGGQSLA